MIRLLLFGSSHRLRGSGGWTHPEPIASLLATLCPDEVAHGASPSKGADDLVDILAREHFAERGLGSERVRPYPMREHLDGTGGGRFMARNGRMGLDFRPHVGAGLVVGRVGQAVGTRGNYLSNGSQNMADWLRRHRVPTVIIRENGVEPEREPLPMLRRLYVVTQAAELVPAGQALAAFVERGGSRDDAVLALRCARETSRFAAWLEAVERAVAASA